MAVNPWHDIPVGDKAPKIINCIIEIPKDSPVKYELDKQSGLLKLDRYLYSAVHYPADYGLVPQTYWEDDDPLDIFVLTGRPTYPMTLCSVRVIGVIRMIDQDEKDDKIVAVHEKDPRYAEIKSIKDVPKHILAELHNFLETYKELEKKKVEVFEILGPKEAYKDIERSMKLYKEKFKK